MIEFIATFKKGSFDDEGEGVIKLLTPASELNKVLPITVMGGELLRVRIMTENETED